jgi:hypothetical protein
MYYNILMFMPSAYIMAYFFLALLVTMIFAGSLFEVE